MGYLEGTPLWLGFSLVLQECEGLRVLRVASCAPSCSPGCSRPFPVLASARPGRHSSLAGPLEGPIPTDFISSPPDVQALLPPSVITLKSNQSLCLSLPLPPPSLPLSCSSQADKLASSRSTHTSSSSSPLFPRLLFPFLPLNIK